MNKSTAGQKLSAGFKWLRTRNYSWLGAVGGFIRRNFFEIVVGVLVLCGAYFLYSYLSPAAQTNTISKNTPFDDTGQRKAAEDVDLSQKYTDGQLGVLDSVNKGVNDRINRVTRKPSKDVDQAIENWNKGD